MRKPLYFSLDDYFYNTDRCYQFIEGMFKYKKILKKEVLIDLKIPASTYRLNRDNHLSKNDNRIKLLNYFGINDLSINNKKEIELLLNKTYTAIYYKDFAVEDCLNKINEKIQKNDYLKPIFIIFKLLCIVNNDRIHYKEFLDTSKEDFKYLFSMPKEYFSVAFLDLFNILTYISNDANEEYFCKNEELLWMYYNFKGMNCFMKNDYKGAILFYKHAESEYLQDANFVRYIGSRNKIAAMYNFMNEPCMAQVEIEPVSNFVLSTSLNVDIFPIRFIIMHYIMSLFMQKKYSTIIDFYIINKNKENWRNRITIVAVAYAHYYEKMQFDYDFENIDEVTQKYFDVIKGKTKLSKDLYCELNKTQYHEILLATLKK